MIEAARSPWWEQLARAISPIEERPRVVDGIEAVCQTSRDGRAYMVVRSPVANTYLKLDPREFELLALMDGSRSVKALVVAYFQRHGVLALPRIVGLVGLLRAHRFLTEPPLDALAALECRLRRWSAGVLFARLARGLVQTEIEVRGVDRVLDGWYRAWGWLLFTRSIALAGTVLGFLGPLLFLLELSRARYPLFRTGGSYVAGLVLLLLELLVLTVHELGHGLAVKHAGRTVHRAGFLLYYGLPAAFVDTTDVWMAPRRLRLITSFAGPWTGLVIGGLAALGAWALPAGSLGAFLFVWCFVSLINTLANFNPLLELDGYYLLVDLIEKPMLRARALTFVRGPLWTRLRQRQRLSGEEQFFAWFGLATLVYSGLSLFLALSFWSRWLLPALRGAWQSDQPLARLAVLLVGLAIATPLALAAWAGVRSLSAAVARRLILLNGRAAARRHRAMLDALRAVPLWAGLPDGQALEVARAMRVQDVPPGTEVVRQGEPGDRFYLIDYGRFEVLVDGQPVARLGRGDYFGERALLNRAPRAATVVAVEPGRVFWLDQAQFQALLAHDLATRARLEAAVAYRAEVAAMPLFRDLRPVELDLLLARLIPIRVEAGAAIIHQGEPGDRFYIIRSGSVQVERDDHLLATLGPGETFGEIALLHNVPRTATVRAVEPTELLALEATDFHDLLASYFGRAEELERLSHLRLATHHRLDQIVAR